MNNSFWVGQDGNQPDLLCGRSEDYSLTTGHFPLLICSTVALGGLLRFYLRNQEFIVLTILSILGFGIGQLALRILEVHKLVYPLLRTSSFSLFCYFSPLILFMAALDVDFHILKNVFWQVLLMGFISFVTAVIITGFVVLKFNKYAWNLQYSLLFSMALGVTDPIHSVNSMKSIGISKMHTDIIRGESMIIFGFTCVFFGNFRSNLPGFFSIKELHIVMALCLSILGSTVCGYWCAKIIQFIMTDHFSNTLTNVVLCISMVYLIFYIVEFFGMSGVVAVVAVGLQLDSLSFKPRIELIITKFLIMFSSVYQHLIYTFFGIIVGCGEIDYLGFHTIIFIFILFTTVNIVRLVTVILVSPILMHSSYEFNWRWAVVMAWSGIKGSLNLLLAPDIFNVAEEKIKSPQMFIVYIQVISLITMGVNSYMMTHSARKLGLCAISVPRQIVIQNAMKHIQEIIHNTITLNKAQKILTNVNWTIVEEKTRLKYIIPSDMAQIFHASHETKEKWNKEKEEEESEEEKEEEKKEKKEKEEKEEEEEDEEDEEEKEEKGKEEEKDEQEEEEEKEQEETPKDQIFIEEARVHVALIQMSSFEKQCNDGILSIEAARILIGATKSYWPVKGKFMSIYDVSTYIRTRSWLVKFKNILVFLGYHKEKVPTISSENKFLSIIHHIVFSEEFEYIGYIVALMYLYPWIVHLWPMARELNVPALISVNDYFVFLYALQTTLKIIVFKMAYFQQYWNILEFLITTLGIVDAICIYFVKMRPDNMILIESAVIIGYLRAMRFIPLIKITIPLLKTTVEVQIKKRLSLMYSITKGYVKSQDDTKIVIKQISSVESVNRKIYDILETNKRDAIKQLGLIEHECRDVVIALKTRQAIQNVITKALKNLTFLWSRGIIDKHEGVEMNKVLLSKIKALNQFPMTIPPPTPDKYLHNIVWLENNNVLIEFFKERARLAYFDYGDIICREGEMPQGIYLIISGMAILHSSPPSFGIDSSLRHNRVSQTIFTDYCTSGDVIGELSCLLKHGNEYTAICETTLQDLYEGFDVFWPSLEYKIWLKLALNIAYQYFESHLVDEDLTFQKCVVYNQAYVETLSSYNEMTINSNSMKYVIIVHGSVIDTKTEISYLAPCILPKTCEQVQGISDLSKLLVIKSSESSQDNRNASVVENWTLFYKENINGTIVTL